MLETAEFFIKHWKHQDKKNTLNNQLSQTKCLCLEEEGKDAYSVIKLKIKYQ